MEFKSELQEQAYNSMETKLILVLDVEDALTKEINSLEGYTESYFRSWTNQLKNRIINHSYDLKAISALINKWIFKFDITFFNDSQNIIIY